MTEGIATLADGGKLSFDVRGAGAGAPLLLIRPLGGSTSLWGEFRDELARRFCVISYDLRGTGRSSQESRLVTTRMLADDAVQLLDHLNVTRAHVFGISLGGMIASWVALRAPQRVDKLCLACTTARGVALTHAGLGRGLMLGSCFVRPRQEVEVALVRHVLSRVYRRTHPEQLSRIEELVRAHPSTPSVLLRHALAGARHDVRSKLHELRMPTLVLAGERDHLLGPEPPRALARALANARLELVADSGHDVTLEQPLRTAAQLTRFLLG